MADEAARATRAADDNASITDHATAVQVLQKLLPVLRPQDSQKSSLGVETRMALRH